MVVVVAGLEAYSIFDGCPSFAPEYVLLVGRLVRITVCVCLSWGEENGCIEELGGRLDYLSKLSECVGRELRDTSRSDRYFWGFGVRRQVSHEYQTGSRHSLCNGHVRV